MVLYKLVTDVAFSETVYPLVDLSITLKEVLRESSVLNRNSLIC
jgi:hypothetical protein